MVLMIIGVNPKAMSSNLSRCGDVVEGWISRDGLCGAAALGLYSTGITLARYLTSHASHRAHYLGRQCLRSVQLVSRSQSKVNCARSNLSPYRRHTCNPSGSDHLRRTLAAQRGFTTHHRINTTPCSLPSRKSSNVQGNVHQAPRSHGANIRNVLPFPGQAKRRLPHPASRGVPTFFIEFHYQIRRSCHPGHSSKCCYRKI